MSAEYEAECRRCEGGSGSPRRSGLPRPIRRWCATGMRSPGWRVWASVVRQLRALPAAAGSCCSSSRCGYRTLGIRGSSDTATCSRATCFLCSRSRATRSWSTSRTSAFDSLSTGLAQAARRRRKSGRCSRSPRTIAHLPIPSCPARICGTTACNVSSMIHGSRTSGASDPLLRPHPSAMDRAYQAGGRRARAVTVVRHRLPRGREHGCVWQKERTWLRVRSATWW